MYATLHVVGPRVVLSRPGMEKRRMTVQRRRPTWRRLATFAMCLALYQMAPVAARAQDEGGAAARTEQEARQAFERGRIHYENGDFSKAADAFAMAYELSGKPDLLYNLYVAYRDANQQTKAAEALRDYLQNAEVVHNRPQLEARLEALEAGIAKREVETAAAEPPPEKASEQVQQEPEPELAAEPMNDRWWLYPTVVLASGGALMLASVPTGVMARSKAQELHDECDPVCDPEKKATRDSGKTLALVTDVLMFGGAAVAVGGAIWMILARPDENEAVATGRVRPGFACAPGACGGSLTVDF